MTCLTYEKIAWAAVLYRAAASDELRNKRGEVTLTYHDLVQRLTELQLENIDTNTATDLISFLNRWGRCRLARHYSTEIRKTLAQLPSGLRNLSPLIEQNGDAVKLVEESYSVLQRFGPTAASKILHLIHTPSFMMWDTQIRKHCQSPNSAKGYVAFLDRMQLMGRHAVRDFGMTHPNEDLPTFLCGKLKLPHTLELTKLLDEYNWITITRKVAVPPVWPPCQL